MTQLTLAEPQRQRLELLERETEAAAKRLGRLLRAPRLSRMSIESVKIMLERAVGERK